MITRSIAPLCLATTALVSCGVPVDERAQPLSGDEVRPSPPTAAPTPTTRAADPSLGALELFLVRESRLVPVRRGAATPSVANALEALTSGPTSSERSQGLRTALAGPVRLAGMDGAAVPVVDVADSFGQIEGEEQILALAQIVFTLTAVPGVEGVAFALSEREVEVPTGDGTLKAGPLRRDDFAAVAPRG